MEVALTRCAASHLMTGLLAWRNPQGSEENWLLRPQAIENIWKHVGKVISSEIGLVIITATAAVETVAYSVLATASLTLYPLTDKPCRFFAKILQSSAFTIIWGVANAILFNPCFVNTITHESFARDFAKTFNPTPISMLRWEDARYLANWIQQHMPEHVNDARAILDEGPPNQKIIDEGATFILQDILEGATADTKDLFKATDPSILMFMLTKAIYIYAVGVKKEVKIPGFFKPVTKEFISLLRQEENSPETLQELSRLVTDPIQFEEAPQSELAKALFDRLKRNALGELQKSLFITRCLQKAVSSFKE